MYFGYSVCVKSRTGESSNEDLYVERVAHLTDVLSNPEVLQHFFSTIMLIDESVINDVG